MLKGPSLGHKAEGPPSAPRLLRRVLFILPHLAQLPKRMNFDDNDCKQPYADYGLAGACAAAFRAHHVCQGR